MICTQLDAINNPILFHQQKLFLLISTLFRRYQSPNIIQYRPIIFFTPQLGNCEYCHQPHLSRDLLPAQPLLRVNLCSSSDIVTDCHSSFLTNCLLLSNKLYHFIPKWALNGTCLFLLKNGTFHLDILYFLLEISTFLFENSYIFNPYFIINFYVSYRREMWIVVYNNTT